MKHARVVTGFTPSFKFPSLYAKEIEDAARTSWAAVRELGERLPKVPPCKCEEPRVRNRTDTCLICEGWVSDDRLCFKPEYKINVKDDPLRHLYDPLERLRMEAEKAEKGKQK